MTEGRAGLSLEINGRQVAVQDNGTGPGVLLLADPGDARQSWEGQLPALVGAGYRVVVPGLLEAPAVEQLRAVLRVLGIPRVHVVGTGGGGALAWEFARLQPQRVDRVVLVGWEPPSAPGTDLTEAVLTVADAEGPAEQPERFNRLLIEYLATPDRAGRAPGEVRGQVGGRLGTSLARRLRQPGERG